MTSRLTSGMSPLITRSTSDERPDQRILVVDVELQRLGLAGRQLAGDRLRPRLVDVGEDDGGHLRLGGDGAGRHLADGSDAQLKYSHDCSRLSSAATQASVT